MVCFSLGFFLFNDDSSPFILVYAFTLVCLSVQQIGGGNGRIHRLSGEAVVFSVLFYLLFLTPGVLLLVSFACSIYVYCFEL